VLTLAFLCLRDAFTMTIYLPQLTADETQFPDAKTALNEPEGLLAMGGDLAPKRLLNAYRCGIFPWFSEGEPILWWSPAERATIEPQNCHISSSMRRLIRKNNVTVTINHAFPDVINYCAQPRAAQAETWITKKMIDAYIKLHHYGAAHSIEVWQGDKLVGGLYGVAIGRIFCGESMFSRVSNSSKIAFIALNQHLSRFSGKLIDCQMQTAHLRSLGVLKISRQQFILNLQKYRDKNTETGCWQRQTISLSCK